MNITSSSFLTKLSLIIGLAFLLQVLSIEFIFADDPAPASGATDQLTCTLKRIVTSLTGPMGKAIATIAIIALGIGLFMGKLSWGLAVATALGIAMIFGADSIVSWLSGGGFAGTDNCPTNTQ